MNYSTKYFFISLILAIIFQVWWMRLDGLIHWQAIPAQIGFMIAGYNFKEGIIDVFFTR